jgi:acyl-coenzyme A synthetase/AMP-(fatty) acid ligase
LIHDFGQQRRSQELPEGTLDFEALVGEAAPAFETVRTQPEDYALLHFTSGTTGLPKGVLHAHAAVTAHLATARWVLDLQDDDVYWCTADPGWVTGISYGVIAPLACGVTLLVLGLFVIGGVKKSADHYADNLFRPADISLDAHATGNPVE